MALLSSPLLSNAGSNTKTSPLQIEVSDGVAGMTTFVIVTGESYKNIELLVLKPSGESLLMNKTSDAQGESDFELSGYHSRKAGVYQVSARNAEVNGNFSKPIEFKAYPGSVSVSKSGLIFAKQSAQLGETVPVTVNLVDEYLNPIQGHSVQLIPSDSTVTAFSPDMTTNELGKMNYYLSATESGIFDLTAFDSSIDKTLSSKNKIAFSGEYDPDVSLASTVGPIKEFILSGLNSTSVVGDDSTVNVKAVDSSGFTVTDYTGTIRFSSTDSKASLPSDYTFLAEDQGEHSFSLGVKFVTPGEQTLSTTDIDQISVTGSMKTTVAITSASGVTYDATFETTDFSRDGDFTLISPAAGTYSMSSLEVQGEGEYGYTAVIYLNGEEAGRTEAKFDNSFTYDLQDLEDGIYELYVDIVKLGDGEPGKEEILEVVETSDSEKINIDTTAPALKSIKSSVESEIQAGDTVTITVLSEAKLEEASLLFQGEVFTMKETQTSGKYEVDLLMPETPGDYKIDVILMDSLGNEAQYRNQATLTVGGGAATAELPAVPSAAADAIHDQNSTEMLNPVTGVTATESEDSVLLSWETPDSQNLIAYYRVYYGPSQSSLFALSETYDSSTTWRILDLTADQTYYFAVSAVDVEGNEGSMSDTVMGVPYLGRSGTDNIDDTSPTPEITGLEANVSGTPESGPAQTMIIILGLVGAVIYTGARKRASSKSF